MDGEEEEVLDGGCTEINLYSSLNIVYKDELTIHIFKTYFQMELNTQNRKFVKENSRKFAKILIDNGSNIKISP